MRQLKHYRWAIVFRNGHIDHSTIRCARRAVISAEIKDYREVLSGWGDLSDAQFWRKLKRRHRMSVRRIELVVR